MEEVSPVVTVPFRLGNLVCDDSKLTACMELAEHQLIANTSTLLSDRCAAVVLSVGNKVTVNQISLEEDNGEDVFRPWDGGQLMDNSSSLSLDDDTKSICSEELLGLKGCFELYSPSSVDVTQNPHTLQHNVAVLAVGGEGSDPKLFPRVLELSKEERTNRTVSDLGFEFDSLPLWGFTSICGRRLEMEDAVAAVPNFLRVPLHLPTDGTKQDLDYLTAYFFGVYDGHGGCQVHLLSSLPSFSMLQCTFCLFCLVGEKILELGNGFLSLNGFSFA